MSVAEMKKLINEKVETMSEEQLFALKEMLDNIIASPAKEYDLLRHAETIFSEREEVLKKLAK